MHTQWSIAVRANQTTSCFTKRKTLRIQPIGPAGTTVGPSALHCMINMCVVPLAPNPQPPLTRRCSIKRCTLSTWSFVEYYCSLRTRQTDTCPTRSTQQLFQSAPPALFANGHALHLCTVVIEHDIPLTWYVQYMDSSN